MLNGGLEQEPKMTDQEMESTEWDGEFDENGRPTNRTFMDYARSVSLESRPRLLSEIGVTKMLLYLELSETGRMGMAAYFFEEGMDDDQEISSRLEQLEWWRLVKQKIRDDRGDDEEDKPE